jgi:ADP-ribose pyrophosphatase YjhB (NUDIX family)
MEAKTKEATCVYLVRKTENKWEVMMADQQAKIVGTKGYGGKIKPGQSATQNVVEETREETGGVPELRLNKNEEGGIEILLDGLSHMGTIDFYNGTEAEVPFRQPSFTVHFFTCSTFSGKPVDTIEMQNHQWYPIDNLPFDKMIIGDELILKPIFEGRTITGWMRRTADLSTIIDYEID